MWTHLERQRGGIGMRGRGEDTRELFFGTEIRTRHSETILRTYKRLIESARDCDPDGIITDALLGGAHGTLYQIILEQRDTVSA